MNPVTRVEHRGDLWRAAQHKADKTRDDLIAAVIAANEAGVSEYELAIAAGVTRRTIRAWLGK